MCFEVGHSRASIAAGNTVNQRHERIKSRHPGLRSGNPAFEGRGRLLPRRAALGASSFFARSIGEPAEDRRPRRRPARQRRAARMRLSLSTRRAAGCSASGRRSSPNYPSGSAVGALYRSTTAKPALRAAWLMARPARLRSATLRHQRRLLPVLDVPIEGASDVIGTRAYGKDPVTVAGARARGSRRA